jgi:hypothetical protein
MPSNASRRDIQFSVYRVRSDSSEMISLDRRSIVLFGGAEGSSVPAKGQVENGGGTGLLCVGRSGGECVDLLG